MSLFGIPREAVAEAGRLDGLHAKLAAERLAEAKEGKGGTEEKEGLGCRAATAFLLKPGFFLFAFLYAAAPALIPGLAAIFETGTGAPGPLRKLAGAALLLCALLSLPTVMAGMTGRIDPFLALRLPSREALYFQRVSSLGTRVLLSGFGWAAAVAIRLLGADAPAGAILPLAFAAGLLPAAIAVRVAWAKAPDPGTEVIEVSRKILHVAVAVVLTFGIPWVFRSTLREWPSLKGLYLLAAYGWLFYGPVSLLTNGSDVLGRLRRGGIPRGAWARAGLGAVSFLLVIAGVLGTAFIVVAPDVVVARLAGVAGPVGAAAAALLAVIGYGLLRDGMRSFAEREVLPKSAGKAAGGASPRDPSKANRPFPRRARTLMEARHPIHQDFSTTFERAALLLLFAALALFVGFCLAQPKPMVLLLAVFLILPWKQLEHRERAWLLGMDFVEQRRHNLLFEVLWHGALLLGLALLLVPFVGGGPERWALLPYLLGVFVFRLGIAGYEALLRRAGHDSFRSRIPIYLLVLVMIPAPLGGTAWSLAAAAAGIGLGLLGILLEERLMTETVMKEEMLRKAEGA